MGKKNTLLYLDEELVTEAKRANLNLSKIAEKAIETELFPNFSKGEKIMHDIERHLKNLREQNRCFSLPFEIEKVSFENIGNIKHFESEFNKFNLISGSNRPEKTLLIRALAYVFGNHSYDLKRILRFDRKIGKLEVNIVPRNKISFEVRRKEDGSIEEKPQRSCLLLDTPAAALDQNMFVEFIKNLKDMDSQIIMTTSRSLDKIDLEGEDKGIEL